MRPETNTVQQLFERDVRYTVPLYQRPYVWKQDDQWAPLWDDVVAVLDHHPDSEVPTHFLGAIVLDQDRTNPGEIPRYTVIDGQQRLTTLQLLLAAAASAMTEIGADDDSGLLRDLVLNDQRKAKGVEQLKVWPTNADRAAFMNAVGLDQPATTSPTVRRGRDLIDEAFTYFLGQVRQYLVRAESGEVAPAHASDPVDADALIEAGGVDIDDAVPDSVSESPLERASRLRIVLCDLLKLVSITLGRDDNAQVIFETLNARGTPLLALDLVKNVLFHQASRQDAGSDSLYYSTWQPQLDDEYWRTVRRQGRLNRPVGELFLVHWLTMTVRDTIPATELFSTFRQRVLKPSIDAASLIRTLCADAATMRSFDALGDSYSFFKRLPALDANVVLPIALLLFRSSEITEDRRQRALRILESWLARRALTRLTPKNYNRQIPRLVDKMSNDLAHADDVLLEALSGSDGQISRWPSDADVTSYLLGNDVYGVVARPRLVMALTAVETTLYTSKSDVTAIPDGLTLEHIIPQEWEEHWPLPKSDDGAPLTGKALDTATERRTSRLHRLGNLTLVAGGLNSAMQNAAWSDKRPELNRHSRLLLNARLDDFSTFDEAAVDRRGAWLVSRMLDVWPGPDSKKWT